MHGLGIAQEGIEYRNLAQAGRAVRAVEVHQQWTTAKARQAPAHPEVRQGLAGVDEQRGNRKIVLVGIAHCDSLGLAEQEACIGPRGAARTAILGLEWRPSPSWSDAPVASRLQRRHRSIQAGRLHEDVVRVVRADREDAYSCPGQGVEA